MEDAGALKKEIEELRGKVFELEEKLKKYTNGDNHKRYYEKNKEIIKEAGSNYLKKLKEENPEKLKEYRKRAYQKRKEKLLKEELELEN
jgi:predicted MPP superfamily phosphohydrolase